MTSIQCYSLSGYSQQYYNLQRYKDNIINWYIYGEKKCSFFFSQPYLVGSAVRRHASRSRAENDVALGLRRTSDSVRLPSRPHALTQHFLRSTRPEVPHCTPPAAPATPTAHQPKKKPLTERTRERGQERERGRGSRKAGQQLSRSVASRRLRPRAASPAGARSLDGGGAAGPVGRSPAPARPSEFGSVSAWEDNACDSVRNRPLSSPLPIHD